MNSMATDVTLPSIIAGPILRKVEAHAMHLWLATSLDITPTVNILHGANTLISDTQCTSIQIGERLFIKLITVTLEDRLPKTEALGYRLTFEEGRPVELNGDNYLYDEKDDTIQFIWKPEISSLLHGSCRKAHFGYQQLDSRASIGDGLAQADRHLSHTNISDWPSLLMLSGDQIYADDVAGPMLYAIRQAVDLLGIKEERLPESGHRLYDDPFYYCREALLPKSEEGDDVRRQFFKGKKKPVFTTDT
ncbi:MAG: hypothetical protein KC467_11540, partial [Marinomonas atlantica]|nr:hypothetical protein [Marinomonas atlantica]